MTISAGGNSGDGSNGRDDGDKLEHFCTWVNGVIGCCDSSFQKRKRKRKGK